MTAGQLTKPTKETSSLLSHGKSLLERLGLARTTHLNTLATVAPISAGLLQT